MLRVQDIGVFGDGAREARQVGAHQPDVADQQPRASAPRDGAAPHAARRARRVSCDQTRGPRERLTARAATGAFVLVAAGCSVAALAQAPAAGPFPAAGAQAVFRFTTSVTTPKGKQGGSGTIALKHTEGRALTMTVHSDDGSPPKTIALVINGDGSVSPDPNAPQPAATTAPDAAARAFMADVTLAAHV